MFFVNNMKRYYVVSVLVIIPLMFSIKSVRAAEPFNHNIDENRGEINQDLVAFFVKSTQQPDHTINEIKKMSEFQQVQTEVVKDATASIDMPDLQLRIALNQILGKGNADESVPTVEELASLTGTIDLSKKGIQNLEGIEFAINIETLNLNNNAITDIYLHDMPNLQQVTFEGNKTASFTLENLPKYAELKLANKVSVYGGLRKLTLKNMELLQTIDIGNEIWMKDELGPSLEELSLENLPNLTRNSVRNYFWGMKTNKLKKVELKKLPLLTSYNLKNGILEEATISDLTTLTTLDLAGNQLTNEAFDVSNLPIISQIIVSSNQLTSPDFIQVLAENTQAETFNATADKNKIIDATLIDLSKKSQYQVSLKEQESLIAEAIHVNQLGQVSVNTNEIAIRSPFVISSKNASNKGVIEGEWIHWKNLKLNSPTFVTWKWDSTDTAGKFYFTGTMKQPLNYPLKELTAQMSADKEIVGFNETVRYQVEWMPEGDEDVTSENIVISTKIPEGMTYVIDSLTTENPDVTVKYDTKMKELLVSFPSPKNGQTQHFSFETKVTTKNNSAGAITITSIIGKESYAQIYTNSVKVSLKDFLDFSKTKLTAPAQVSAGNEITYHLTVDRGLMNEPHSSGYVFETTIPEDATFVEESARVVYSKGSGTEKISIVNGKLRIEVDDVPRDTKLDLYYSVVTDSLRGNTDVKQTMTVSKDDIVYITNEASTKLVPPYSFTGKIAVDKPTSFYDDILTYTLSTTFADLSNGESDDMSIDISLPNDTELLEETIQVNGQLITETNYQFQLENQQFIIQPPNWKNDTKVDITYQLRVNGGEPFDTLSSFATLKKVHFDHTNVPKEVQTNKVTTKLTEVPGQPVKVKYQNLNGDTLAPDQILTGNLGRPYEAIAQKIYGYSLLKIPDNIVGKFTSKEQTVLFIYEPMFGEEVVVRYIDQDGQDLTEPIHLTDYIGKPYVTTSMEFDNHILLKQPVNALGTFEDYRQEVLYEYQAISGEPITVKHLDEEGQAIFPEELIEGYLGKPYQTTSKESSSYRLLRSSKNTSGLFQAIPQEVIYIYEAVAAGNVTVKYQDLAGQTLASDDVFEGLLGEKIKATPKDIIGYRLISTPFEGTFEKEAQTIVYQYEMLPSQPVIVHHQDKNGQNLAPNDTLTGGLGESYQTEEKEIKGYQLVQISENLTGIFTIKEQNVYYTYEGVSGGNIIVKYQDEQGNQIAKDTLVKGNLDHEYQTKAQIFDDYELIKTPKNAIGRFTDKEQTVIYIYQLKQGGNITVKYHDMDGNTLAQDTLLEGKRHAEYQTKPLEINSYRLVETPKNATGTFATRPQTVTYLYEKSTIGHVWVTYQNKFGRDLAETVLVRGEIGTRYETERKQFDNYHIVKTPENATGTFSLEKQTVSYIYERNTISTGKVTIKYQDMSGKTLAPEQQLVGTLDVAYATAPKDIEGYVVAETPENAIGYYQEEEQIIIYRYKVAEYGKVIIKYQDTEGKQLATDTVLTGLVDKPYQTKAKDIVGYLLVDFTSNTKGNFTTEDQIIVYTYDLTDNVLNLGSIRVEYQDTEGKVIAQTDYLKGKIGSSYLTLPKNIRGYELIEQPANSEGFFKKELQKVIFIYQKLALKTVTVKHLDADSKPLRKSEVLTGYIGESYETFPDIPKGYTQIGTPSNANGLFKAENQTVTYFYGINDLGHVLVKHEIRGDGSKVILVSAEVLKGTFGEAYETEALQIPGYQLVQMPTNHDGIFKEAAQEVLYLYEPIPSESPGRVIVSYQDQNGLKLADDVVLEGQINERYESEAKPFSGFRLVEMPKNATGLFNKEIQTVQYVYEPLPESSVVVKYQDTAGQLLSDEVLLKGEIGSRYESQGLLLNGYRLIKMPENAIGTFKTEIQEVIYVYAPIPAGQVIVHYQDTEKNDLAENIVLEGQIGKPYITKGKEIDGYQLLEYPDNQTGNFTENSQEVFYLYAPIEAGKVTVRYQDTKGYPLKEDIVLNGKVNQSYETIAENVKGYQLVSLPENALGIFKKEEQTVLYVYEKKPTSGVLIHYVDDTNNHLAIDEHLIGEVDTSYHTKPKDISNYHLIKVVGNEDGLFKEDLDEVTYIYQKNETKAAAITIRYQDTMGRLLSEEITLEGNIGDTYHTNAKKFSHYVLTKIPENQSGNFTESPQIITYVYTKLVGYALVVHQTKEGQILGTDFLEGYFDETFETTANEFPTYHLIQAPEKINGVFSDTLQTLTYLYQRESKLERVIVKYQDQQGQIITEDTILEGALGTRYQTQAKKITGYQLHHVKGNIHGFYQENEQVVIYVYDEATKSVSKEIPFSDEKNESSRIEENQLPATGEKTAFGWTNLGILSILISWILKKRTFKNN